jgi:hypothetical protein
MILNLTWFRVFVEDLTVFQLIKRVLCYANEGIIAIISKLLYLILYFFKNTFHIIIPPVRKFHNHAVCDTYRPCFSEPTFAM